MEFVGRIFFTRNAFLSIFGCGTIRNTTGGGRNVLLAAHGVSSYMIRMPGDDTLPTEEANEANAEIDI